MFNAVFNTSLALIWFMLLYHMFLTQGGFMLYRSYRRPIAAWEARRLPLPMVTVLVPAHNEEVVIARTIRALARLDYPRDKLQVIIINDNSSDRTGAIADAATRPYAFMQVLHLDTVTAGRGKSGALNRALPHAKGEMVVVYDADNTPERQAVYYLALALINSPDAGAVVGKFRVINAAATLLTRFINIETICFQWMAQAGRSHWFGLTTIPGTNFGIRTDLLRSLGGWDEQALTEDTELTIRIYNAGYRVVFFPAAITWEQEPETWGVWWRQRTRWARGNVYVVGKYLGQFFKLWPSPVLLDLLYFFATYLGFFVGVIVSDGLFVANLFWKLELKLGTVTMVLWVLAYFVYTAEVLMTLSMEDTELNGRNVLIVMLMYLTYSQLWLLLVAWAVVLELKRLVVGGERTWYKTPRFQTVAASPRRIGRVGMRRQAN